jgi:hypothetical protein
VTVDQSEWTFPDAEGNIIPQARFRAASNQEKRR